MVKYKTMVFYIASIGLLLFIAAVLYFYLVWRGSMDYMSLPVSRRFFVWVGVLGGGGFWFSMLADFFRNTDIKNRVVWGFSLILFWWIASLLYFFMHFLPRVRSSKD